VSDPSLKLLVAGESGFFRVRNDVDDCDAVETNHFLEIDETLPVSIDVFERRGVVGSVRIRFEKSTPFTANIGMSRDMKEDRVGRRFENGVSLFRMQESATGSTSKEDRMAHLVLELHIRRETSESESFALERNFETDCSRVLSHLNDITR